MQFFVKSIFIAALIMIGACATPGGPGPSPSERIRILETNGRYIFSVPVSQLLMTMPKRGWSLKNNDIGGSTSNPRYFYFENGAEHAILSGWFEPDRLFTSVKQLWEEESGKRQKGSLPAAANVTYEQLGGWDTVMYDYVMGELTSSHIRGHWVQSGTWIDLHISITDKSATENRKKLKTLLKEVKVADKREFK